MAKAKDTDKTEEVETTETHQDDSQSLVGSGQERLHVQANVSIFHLHAGQTGYVDNTAETHAAIESGKLSQL